MKKEKKKGSFNGARVMRQGNLDGAVRGGSVCAETWARVWAVPKSEEEWEERRREGGEPTDALFRNKDMSIPQQEAVAVAASWGLKSFFF